MNSSIHRFSLDVQKSQSQVSIPVSLGDTGRTFQITLSDGGRQYIITEGCLAKISITRPTGTHIEDFCAIEDNTTIVYKFSQNKNTAAVEGIHECDVTLYDSEGEILTSARFTMVVSERVHRSDDIVVTDEDRTAIDAVLIAEAERKSAEDIRKAKEAERQASEEARLNAGAVALQSAESAKSEANRAKEEADRAEEASSSAAKTAAEVATEEARAEVESLVGELGIEQSMGDSIVATMSQKTITDNIKQNRKRITNLEQGIVPDPFYTDDSVAYYKTPPQYALPYAEIEKIGGMTYRDDESGTLKNAAVSSMSSCGVNLLPFPYRDSSKTENGLTFTVNSDNSITVNGTASKETTFYLRGKRLPAKRFCLSGCPVGGTASTFFLRIQYLQATGEEKLYYDFGEGGAFIADENRSYAVYILVRKGTVMDNLTFFPMLNVGTKKLPYEKYKVNALEIPQAVQSLEGYGEGMDEDRFNHIQWTDGKSVFNRMVKSYTVAAEDVEEVTKYVYDNVMYFRFPKPLDALDYGQYSHNYLSTMDIVEPNGLDNANSIGRISGKAEPKYYWVGFAKGTTLEQAQAALDGFKIVYQLATTEVTDISDLLSDDNFIEVAEGGMVYAENENYLSVPTTITYQFPIERATGYEDGDEVSY